MMITRTAFTEENIGGRGGGGKGMDLRDTSDLDLYSFVLFTLKITFEFT